MLKNESVVLFTLNQYLEPDINRNEIDNPFNYQRNACHKQKPKPQIYFK